MATVNRHLGNAVVELMELSRKKTHWATRLGFRKWLPVEEARYNLLMQMCNSISFSRNDVDATGFDEKGRRFLLRGDAPLEDAITVDYDSNFAVSGNAEGPLMSIPSTQ